MSRNQILLNSMATRSFRDVADQDYVAARQCYRAGLMIQFLWMSQQAIEKYLKAILLFNGKSAKGLSHNLDKAFSRVEKIAKIEFSISDNAREFLGYLNGQGCNRYLEQVHYTRGSELAFLDLCVWEIRMYCRVLDYELRGRGSMLPHMIRRIGEWKSSDFPHKFSITGGFLEKILKQRAGYSRESLVWMNMFYGSVSRKKIKIPNNSNSINPPHVLHPEKFDFFAQHIDFPRAVRNHFSNSSLTVK